MSYLAMKDRDADAASHATCIMGGACAGTPEDCGLGAPACYTQAPACGTVRTGVLEGTAAESDAAAGEIVSDIVCDAVKRDIEERKQLGMIRYGKPLRLGVNDGRDPIAEAYAEALDMAVYLRWSLDERHAMQRRIADLEKEVKAYEINAEAEAGFVESLTDENTRLRKLADDLCERLALASAALGRAAERQDCRDKCLGDMAAY